MRGDGPGRKLDATPSALSSFSSLVAKNLDVCDAPRTLPAPADDRSPDADTCADGGRSSTSSVFPRPIFVFQVLKDAVSWRRASAAMETWTKYRQLNLTARTRGVTDGGVFVVVVVEIIVNVMPRADSSDEANRAGAAVAGTGSK